MSLLDAYHLDAYYTAEKIMIRTGQRLGAAGRGMPAAGGALVAPSAVATAAAPPELRHPNLHTNAAAATVTVTV